jgi:hypothetical protein
LRKYRANLIVFLEISLKSVPLVRKPPDPGATTTPLLFPMRQHRSSSPEGDTSLPVCVSHRTRAPPPTLFFPDAPASVFKPGGRHFPAGVRKPPDAGLHTTTSSFPMRQHRSSSPEGDTSLPIEIPNQNSKYFQLHGKTEKAVYLVRKTFRDLHRKSHYGIPPATTLSPCFQHQGANTPA